MIKQLNDELYKTLCEWWEGHNWTAQPREILSPYGYVSFLNDKPVMSAFLYKTEGSCLGWMEWILSNPESSYDERTECFKELVSFIEVKAKELGIKAIFTATKSASLSKRLDEIGFIKTDENVNHYIKGV